MEKKFEKEMRLKAINDTQVNIIKTNPLEINLRCTHPFIYIFIYQLINLSMY